MLFNDCVKKPIFNLSYAKVHIVDGKCHVKEDVKLEFEDIIIHVPNCINATDDNT